MTVADSGAAEQADKPLDFEAALGELEGLVGKMEDGSLSLEESLAAFERGVKLARVCQAALRAAELRVKALTEDGEEIDQSLPVGDGASSPALARPPTEQLPLTRRSVKHTG